MSHVWGKMTNKIDKITNILVQDVERMGLLHGARWRHTHGYGFVILPQSSCPDYIPTENWPIKVIRTANNSTFWVNSFHNRIYVTVDRLLDSICKSVATISYQNQLTNYNRRIIRITLKQRFVHEEGTESISDFVSHVVHIVCFNDMHWHSSVFVYILQ